jgi:DegV family protein with EDD domain
MSKIGIIACGNSGIDYIDHPYDIPVLRSVLMVGKDEYHDYIDIKAPDFYQMLKDNKELSPSTAQVSTGVILEEYKKMFRDGYDELLVITISKELSGTYEGCMLAAKMLPEHKVTVFDSKTVSYPEAKMILEAAEMASKNKKIEQIIERLEALRDHNHIYFSVETLRYLVKNGRLSGASGFLGSMLKIKPMLEVTKLGKVEAIEKIRTTKKATERLIEKFLEELGDRDSEVFLIEANSDERVNYVRKKLLEARPDLYPIKDYPLTPVVGAHAGPGVVGVGYILK